jgi:putative ABC transport system permease protein
LALLESPGRLRNVWLPKVFQEYETRTRGTGWWAAIGRLRSGMTLEQAQADLDVVSAALAREFPGTNATARAVIEPIGEHVIGDARPALTLLLVAVVVVLLVACANVTNMMLARAADRDREFAVRGALGAGRGRLARQLLTESVLLSVAGAAVGIGFAAWLLRVVVALAPSDLPRLDAIGLNWTLAAVAVGLGLVTGVLAGLAPAWQFSRPRAQDALAAGRGSTTSRGGRIVRDGLVMIEVALAVALVVGAGLLLRSFGRLLDVDPGFRTNQVLALQVFAWDRDLRTPARRAVFFRETTDEMRALPGVVEAGAVSAMPFIGANINIQGPLTIEGRPAVRAEERPNAHLTVATPEYFPAMDIPVIRGRGLARTDTDDTTPVAVVSAAMANRHWPDTSPVGSFVQLTFAGAARRVEIVGVVGDLRHDSLDTAAREELFLPHAQLPYGSMTYVLQTAGEPWSLAETAQKVVWSRDPLMAFYDTVTVADLVNRSVAPRRFSLILVGTFAVTALVLALAGIYGVLSFTTSRQTREFGVRMAMGATGRSVARMVIGRGLRLSAVGLAVGLSAAVLAGRALEAHLFGVSPLDPMTMAGVAVLVLASATTACYVPARRAMRVDPLEALRD